MISFVSSLSSLMKTTFTIAAIAMFAVILGMSSLAPAMAAPAEKIWVCHFSEAVVDETTGEVIEEATWKLIHINGNGWNGHENHNDGGDPAVFDEQGTEEDMTALCDLRNTPDDPIEIPIE